MQVRIGINGFGRIGRNAARIILSGKGCTLAAVNSKSDALSHGYLLQHDSVYGTFDRNVTVNGDFLTVGKNRIYCFGTKEPSEIPWGLAGVDVVLECTGKFRTRESAALHLRESVKKVIISAPAKDATPTYVMGVNNIRYTNETVISNSSCTTNCVATVLKVLDDALGVDRGNMTTIHAVTDSQNLLDNSHSKEIRLRRNSLLNLIPASSGSAKDVSKLFPHLADVFPCRAIRVPTSTVSLIDMVAEVRKKTTKDEVNTLFRQAGTRSLKGILGVAGEELVSSDYIKSPYSAVVDPFLTDVIRNNFIHVTAWYDNEWGYANRLVEMACRIVQ